uniref:Uncharacterized protein n=1 Tax=Ciona intestinalis TaxID=7719 RepID=H2XNA1_CIOIN
MCYIRKKKNTEDIFCPVQTSLYFMCFYIVCTF